MRGTNLVALTIICLTGLSGCLGFGEETADDEHADDCEGLEGAAHDECHDDDTGTGGNSTGNQSTVPNVRPVAMLSMTDAEGNSIGNGSAIFVGGNVTFSAAGSNDTDGQIELAALTVMDKNGTRTVSLLDGGVLTDVTMRFDSHGYIVATLRVLDDDGEAASAADYAWVNEAQMKEGELALPAPPEVVGDCAGPGAGADTPVIDNQYSYAETFTVHNGTKWISATATGAVEIAICDPEGNKISEGAAGTTVSTANADAGYPSGVEYYVFVRATEPQAAYTIEIVPHYENKPAA